MSGCWSCLRGRCSRAAGAGGGGRVFWRGLVLLAKILREHSLGHLQMLLGTLLHKLLPVGPVQDSKFRYGSGEDSRCSRVYIYMGLSN